MNMREKMARAIHALDHQDDTAAWDDLEPYMRDHYLNQAAAALDALLEPTRGMVAAGGAQDDDVTEEMVGAVEHWTAMIQAAKDGK